MSKRVSNKRSKPYWAARSRRKKSKHGKVYRAERAMLRVTAPGGLGRL